MNLTTKSSLLLDVMNGANVITDEANFSLSAEGLAFRSMDASHIAMIDVLIPPTDFSKYEVTDGVKFALRTQEVAKILKRFDKDEEIDVSLDGANMVFTDYTKTFKVRTLDASGGDTPIPNLKFAFKVGMTRQDLDKVLADIAVVSEFVTLKLEKNPLEFSGRGDSGEVSISPSNLQSLEKTGTDETAKATYSLDYIIKMVKAVSVDMVTLEYSSKMPLKLSLGRISYFLAPRVAED